MPEITEAYDFRGRTVVDSQGEKIGKVTSSTTTSGAASRSGRS
jgi:hypothetical protein